MTQTRAAISKLKVAFLAPCVGVGGADALMLGLIKYAYNLDFVSIGVLGTVDIKQYEWLCNIIGENIPIHQLDCNQPQIPSISYYRTKEETVYNATLEADIIFTWSCEGLSTCFYNIKKPVIELAQNGDEYAKQIVRSNRDVVDFRVACAHWVIPVFEEKQVDAVIYNGIDPGRVVPRYGASRTRDQWGLKDEKVLLYMGRFVDEKYPQSLIQTLTHLPDDWIGVYVGQGYRANDLYNEAQRYLNPGRVRFMEPQYHVGDILSASDCFLLVSDFEGLSLGVLEAWLAGVPTVLSFNASMKELTDTTKTIYSNFVSVRASGKEIAKAVLESQKETKIIHAARQLVWDYFTLPTIAAQWEDFLYQAWIIWQRKKLQPTMYVTVPQGPLLTSKTATFVHRSA